MKKLTTTLCLTVAVLLGSAGAGMEYTLPPYPGNPLVVTSRSDYAHWHNCWGTETYTGGKKYVGEWGDDNAHEQGTHTTADGGKYVGRGSEI